MLGEHCQPIHIGLLAAMPEELGTILEKLNNIDTKSFIDPNNQSRFISADIEIKKKSTKMTLKDQ